MDKFIEHLIEELQHIYWMKGFDRDEAKARALTVILKAARKAEEA